MALPSSHAATGQAVRVRSLLVGEMESFKFIYQVIRATKVPNVMDYYSCTVAFDGSVHWVQGEQAH